MLTFARAVAGRRHGAGIVMPGQRRRRPATARFPVALAVLAVLSGASPAAETERALEEALAAGAEDAELAPLYLQTGDDLLRRNQPDRAADAFQEALNRGATSFPVPERRRLARHLAWSGRVDAAIAALRDVLAEDPANAGARIELARFLSWRGLLVEAGQQAERVLRDDPGNREARSIRADAASWRGDSGTAQPLYRELLAEEEDFEVRLNYTHDLLSAGRVVQARESREALSPSSDRERDKLASLDTRIERYRPPRVLGGFTRYDDSDDNTRNERLLGGGFSVGNLELSAEVEEVDAHDRTRSVDVQRLRVGAVWPTATGTRLRAGLGIARIDDGTDDEYAIGYLGADGVLGRLRYSAEIEYDVFDETALTATNRIRRTELGLLGSYQFTDRWRLDGDLEFYDFSDDNEGWKVEVTPQYALRVGNPGLRLGYRRIMGGFDRQSGAGYFDPDSLHGDQAVLIGTLYGARLRGDFELYGGQQVTRRFGRRQRDGVVGGSARLSYDFNRHVRLETEVEGGNFSFFSEGGFQYYLLSADLVVFF